VVGYALDGSIDVAAALVLALGAATIGARLGTNLLHRLSQRTLTFAFVAILLLTALRMVTAAESSGGRGALTVGMVIGLFVTGVVAGTTAGLLGVGGGIITVPAMVVAFGIPPAIAKGTSLLVIVPTALAGTRRNMKKQNVDLSVAATVGLAGVASSFVGSRISIGLEERQANVLFAALLAAVAIRMLVGTLRSTDH
uniref:TSUP family transporter n=1 Tax=Gemmatimonas sp. TaxID=1962908 RepID=UPI003562FAD0